jgi:hypothetical protein
MAPKELKVSKQAAAGITRHITFTIPGTLEIIRKPWKCYTPEYHYGTLQDGIVDHLWYKKTQGKNYL